MNEFFEQSEREYQVIKNTDDDAVKFDKLANNVNMVFERLSEEKILVMLQTLEQVASMTGENESDNFKELVDSVQQGISLINKIKQNGIIV